MSPTQARFQRFAKMASLAHLGCFRVESVGFLLAFPYELRSKLLEGDYRGEYRDIKGDTTSLTLNPIIGVIKVDTRSLDYSSCELLTKLGVPRDSERTKGSLL